MTISNNGSADIDLTDWYLVSEQGNQTFSFPSGTIIKTGEPLKIVSGPKAVAGTDTLLWTKSYIWNNDGDPGTLYNSQGQVISRYP